MTPEEEQAVAYHVRELAKLLYKDADASQTPMNNLGEIEAAVRKQVQKHVTHIAPFEVSHRGFRRIIF